MRKVQWIGAMVMVGLLMTLAGCGQEGGAATPKEALDKAAAAVEKADAAMLARCFTPKDAKHPADPMAAAKLMISLKRTGGVMEAVHKKYGDSAMASMGPSAFVLGMMSGMPNMFAAAAKGEIKENGDTATISVKDESEGGVTTSQQLELEKIGGRWYVSTKDMDDEKEAKKMGQFADSLDALLNSMESAMQSAPDAAKFSAQIKPAVSAFTQTMQETMK